MGKRCLPATTMSVDDATRSGAAGARENYVEAGWIGCERGRWPFDEILSVLNNGMENFSEGCNGHYPQCSVVFIGR